ncbi:hypothetical protein [Sphingomonas sp. SUN039]|uniref:hypothetical protein n=1 Tax=Sphingomonas sp. SUN039 TaxID=2937787 RepID=UPI002164B790|nr:hypothetical protein [Sphingomonas sp. SUN039]UVO53682.1 hypothetical protein M0209_05945 [Sphingomonas sp. SUN039]
MILTVETALRGVADILRTRIAPAIDDKFAGETARLAELLLTLNAGWVNDAVAIRVAEHIRVRAMFADAQALIGDAGLALRIAEAARSRDPGLKISELDAESSRLRTLLAELHAHVDEIDSDAGRDFGKRIWRALADFETARAPH